jgi:hypothetical protein
LASDDKATPEESNPPVVSEPEVEEPADRPQIPPEVLEHLPREQREFLQTFMAFGQFPVHNPVLRQIRPEHISKVLDNQAQSAEFDRQSTSESRRWGTALAALLAVLAVAVILTLSLSGHSADLGVVLQYALPFLGGLGAGYFLSESRRKGE